MGHPPTFHAGKLHEEKTQNPENCWWKNSDLSLGQILKIKAVNGNQLWTREVIFKINQNKTEDLVSIMMTLSKALN